MLSIKYKNVDMQASWYLYSLFQCNILLFLICSVQPESLPILTNSSACFIVLKVWSDRFNPPLTITREHQYKLKLGSLFSSTMKGYCGFYSNEPAT